MSATMTARDYEFIPTWEITLFDHTLTGLVVDIHHAATSTGYTTITVEDDNGNRGSERLRRGTLVAVRRY